MSVRAGAGSGLPDAAGAVRAVAPADAEAALDAALAAADTRLAPAVLLAAFDAGGVIAWRALGDPRRDGSEAARCTVFRIASMSKSFLAAAALALADEGRIDLSRSIVEYVPYARFLFRGRAQRVTVGELLGNRSGMPEDNAWGDRQLGTSRDEIAALARTGFELTELPGVRYQYSNLGMSLVGRAIEAVTGRPVEHEVRTRFIEPLGLTDTRYEAGEYGPGSDLAHGFRTFDGGLGFAHEPYVGSGALACIGALFSTVDDIAAWAAFLCSGGESAAFGSEAIRPDLLSARARREMQRAHTAIPIESGDPFRELDALGYWLGLVAEHDRRFGRIAQHSGGLPGFSSHMRWHLESGLGVVAFGNSDAFRTERLAADALARILAPIGRSAAVAMPWTERVWEQTLAAAERIDLVVRGDASFADVDDVTATNLLLDVPEEVRRHRLDRELARVGEILPQPPLVERVVSSQDAAQLRWRIACARGALLCDIRLVGLPHPLVQSLAVEGETNSGEEMTNEEEAAR
ncbi:MAG: beta-lactamase family protein [Actinobacteria bacterium]|nr:beta-lactamase family protein [Actinomycetota bacterium]